MQACRTMIVLAGLAIGGSALAQSTTCMNMGGGMVHCDTMPDMSHPQTGGRTVSVLAEMIARSNERSFQKKVGVMLANGDCVGAAKFAFAKGRLEMGNQISAACSQSRVTSSHSPDNTLANSNNGSNALSINATSPELEERLRIAAAKANSATPTPLNSITTATKVEAIGTQILISAIINSTETSLTDDSRTYIVNQIWSNMQSPELLKAGASIRIKYVNKNGQDVGSVMATRSDCGL